jgi:hypothetical protein
MDTLAWAVRAGGGGDLYLHEVVAKWGAEEYTARRGSSTDATDSKLHFRARQYQHEFCC